MSEKLLDPEAVEQSFQDIEEQLSLLQTTYRDTQQRIQDLEAENRRLRDKIARHEEQLSRMDDITGEKTSKEEKLVAILQYAENIRPDESPKVVLKAKDIKGAAGVTRRYAYDLIDDLPEAYPWAESNSERIDRRADAQATVPPRGLLIDFREFSSENSWGVNQFTGDGGL